MCTEIVLHFLHNGSLSYTRLYYRRVQWTLWFVQTQTNAMNKWEPKGPAWVGCQGNHLLSLYNYLPESSHVKPLEMVLNNITEYIYIHFLNYNLFMDQ